MTTFKRLVCCRNSRNRIYRRMFFFSIDFVSNCFNPNEVLPICFYRNDGCSDLDLNYLKYVLLYWL